MIGLFLGSSGFYTLSDAPLSRKYDWGRILIFISTYDKYQANYKSVGNGRMVRLRLSPISSFLLLHILLETSSYLQFYLIPFPYIEGLRRTNPSIGPMSLSQKRQRAPRKTIGYSEAYVNIISTARMLQVRGALAVSKQNSAREAAAVLENPQHSSSRQKYREFLYEVHTKCGSHGVLLCAVELGQHKAVTMRNKDRAALITQLETSKNRLPISCSVIRHLAEAYGITDFLQRKSNGSNQDDLRLLTIWVQMPSQMRKSKAFSSIQGKCRALCYHHSIMMT